MKRLLLVSALCMAGCVPSGGVKPERPSNKAVLSAVLDSVADVVEHDGGLESPRMVNTSHVTSYLMMALEYRVGDEDIFTPGWLAGYDQRYASRFEPNGEAVPLTDGIRRDVVEFLHEEAEKLNEQ